MDSPTVENLNRLKFIRVAICSALIIGILLSIELWFPTTRSFPRIPVLVALPETLAPLTERVLSVILVISLALAALICRTKAFSIAAIASLTLLIFFDQMRLQPWVYHYILLLSLLTLSDRKADIETASDHALSLVQVVIASLYLWSGLQKLNFSFAYEILPELLLPLKWIIPTADLPLGVMGISLACFETLIGLGLLFRRSRKFSVLLSIGMHFTILGLLIAKDYNSIVWAWNAAQIMVVPVAFWGNNVNIMRIIILRGSAESKLQAARLIALAAAVLPFLSFLGWWDMYLSSALYSGNTSVAVVRIDGETYERLPERARQQVFFTMGTAERMLPLFEWSMADLNVPVYPEIRVYNWVTREICKPTTKKDQVVLIVKHRPAIFSGHYEVTQNSCLQLDR